MTNPLLSKVLIVDDDPRDVTTMQRGIEHKYNFIYASTVDKGLETTYRESPDVVLMDYKFPRGCHGLAGLKEIKQNRPSVVVIFLTRYFDREVIKEAQLLGADDCISKQIDAELLSMHIDRSIQRNLIFREFSSLKENHERNFVKPVFVSNSMMKLQTAIDKLKDTRDTILLTGEPFTGKTTLANWIHHHSIFREKVCQKVFMPELTDETFDLELFGKFMPERRYPYESAGDFELARGGTVILDEIGELPPLHQAKLLKVFQDGCFKQVGGYQNIAHDVRIIATTRLNLPEMVKNGRFRADLFAALSTHTLEVPRLKDRREDISVLCMQILNEYRRTHTTTVKSIDPAVIDEFKSREWPDNVKDLKTLLERALPLCERNTLRLEHICKVEEMNIGIINEPIWSIQKIDEAHLDFQKKYIIFKLKQANGDKALAAAKIGRSTRQLNRWIKELHITPGLYKSSDPE